MSLSKTIFDTIENNIQLYISQVASKFNLDESELYKLWNNAGEFTVKKSSVSVSKTTSEDILDPELMKLNKKELSDLCKAKNLPVSGTKADLIKRIVGNENNKGKSTSSKTTTKQPEVIKKLVEKIPTIQIRRNNFGNFEHAESRLLFNNTTKRAYGRQNDDGSVSELTPEDIDLCHKYKFAYDVPENLDKKDDNDDEDDEELDDEEVVEEDEELEEEELEDLDDDDEEEIEDEEELEEYYDDD